MSVTRNRLSLFSGPRCAAPAVARRCPPLPAIVRRCPPLPAVARRSRRSCRCLPLPPLPAAPAALLLAAPLYCFTARRAGERPWWWHIFKRCTPVFSYTTVYYIYPKSKMCKMMVSGHSSNPDSRSLVVSLCHCLTVSLSRGLTVSRSHGLTVSRFHGLKIQ